MIAVIPKFASGSAPSTHRPSISVSWCWARSGQEQSASGSGTPAKAAELDGWLKQVTEKHKRRILDVDYQVARLWGWVKGRLEVPVIDGLLAATAEVHGLILVTRNVRDIERTGVSYLDPFASR